MWLADKERVRKREGKPMKFLIFGTGEYFDRYKKWLAKEEVVALLDNSSAKQNTFIDGTEVLPPAEGVKFNFDAVVIMSFYVKAMKKQLMELGVQEEKIYHFYDLRKLIHVKENQQKIICYGVQREALKAEAGKRFSLLSTDLTFGGTALALYHMAMCLKKQGEIPLFVSMMDGPLREKITEEGIPVVVDPNLQLATMSETEWLSGARLIVCNAVNYYIFLSERDTDIPVIWWLHDSSFFYDGVDREIFRWISEKNLTVFSVGPVPEQAVHNIRPSLPVRELIYGVPNTARLAEKRKDMGEKVCFVTIGFIEERKGQDILLEAIRLLSEDERENAVFYIVGQDSSHMAARFKKEAESVPEIIVTGSVGREEIHAVLNAAHMFVCPSREDPMPTVAAESMMHGVPCLVSDTTGTAAYIRQGENGLVFKSGDAAGLAGQIRWCIANKTSLAEMGRKAEKVYEEVFSMEAFEKNLSKVISGLL